MIDTKKRLLAQIAQNTEAANSKKGEINLIELEAFRKPLTALIHDNQVFFRLGHVAAILGVGNIRKSVDKYVKTDDTTFFSIEVKGNGYHPTRFISVAGLIDLLSVRKDDESLDFKIAIENNVLPYCSSGTLFASKFEVVGEKIVKRYFQGSALTLLSNQHGLYIELLSLVLLAGCNYQTVYKKLQGEIPASQVVRHRVPVIGVGQRGRVFIKSDTVLELLPKLTGSRVHAVRSWLVDSVIPTLVDAPKLKPHDPSFFEDDDLLLDECLPANNLPIINVSVDGVSIPTDISLSVGDINIVLTITTNAAGVMQAVVNEKEDDKTC